MSEMSSSCRPVIARPMRFWREISAAEFRLLAARRIGELVPNPGHGGKRDKNQVRIADLPEKK